ncbi:MAG: SUMF1/EgtB/PvdO family nonheme iron enzyme, partial [Anaerolineales bacterium]
MAEPASIKEELRNIEAAIQAHEALRGTLPDEQVDLVLTLLNARRQVLLLEVGTGAVAIGQDSKALGQDAILVEGDIEGDFISRAVYIKGNVYFGPKPQESSEALAIYHKVVYQTTKYLPLRGLDLGASDPTTAQKLFGLINVYVGLDTTTQIDIRGEIIPYQEELTILEGREYRLLSTLEATIANRHLVLLGDPGSGKTTFVNFLAHCLAANNLDPNGNWLEHLPGWPHKEANVLPVVVYLRDFAFHLSRYSTEHAEPRYLWEFVNSRLKAQNLELASEPIKQSLERGEALVLLDGLDEIPSKEQRRFVRGAVRAFMERYPENRFLVTCRILSYLRPETSKDPDLRLAELPDFSLAPLNKEKIASFIREWYNELAHIGSIQHEDAPKLAHRLEEAIQHSGLKQLAPNPLLLTVMALFHTHKARLPETRALLYEDTVDILLWRWEEIRERESEELPQLHKLLLDAGRGDIDLKRVLWALAYEAQLNIEGINGSEIPSDISEIRLQKALATLNNDDRNWANKVILTMKNRAGLLIERAPGVFALPHRTYQEYLAGAHLASLPDFVAQSAELSVRDMIWREVILLAIGRLVHISGDIYRPLALIGELCPEQFDHTDEKIWRNTWLSGDLLLEIGTNRTEDSVLGVDLLQRVKYRLVVLVTSEYLSPIERARAGNTLAELGDPRFDSTKWFLPDDPLLGFVEIPAGSFLMGTDLTEDEFDNLREKPIHQVDLPKYYISRYPVTVAQFRAFVEDSGYKPRSEDSLSGHPNHPVVYASWHDAVEYCKWLTDKLKNWHETPTLIAELLNTDGWQISLPTEAEWEKAARGQKGSIYPWGDVFDTDKANVGEIGIAGTSTVGCFSEGASEYGILDVSGNVWEWCSSLYRSYPYLYNDGRENMVVNGHRVVRGGSYNYYHR